MKSREKIEWSRVNLQVERWDMSLPELPHLFRYDLTYDSDKDGDFAYFDRVATICSDNYYRMYKFPVQHLDYVLENIENIEQTIAGLDGAFLLDNESRDESETNKEKTDYECKES